MKKKILIAGVISAVIALAVACKDEGGSKQAQPVALTEDSLVKRGKYLVNVMGCNDCHSPKIFGPHGPEPDPERLLSGHPSDLPLAKIDTTALKSWVLFNPMATATVGPWGVSFAANLTGDDTGIGTWTEAQFFKAIREGKYKGLDNTRMLMPPMPWAMIGKLTDEDLKAVFLYLKSTKKIKNIVPAYIPPNQIGKQG